MQLLSRFGLPHDLATLAGVERLVTESTSETRHLDFKREVRSSDDLADDITAFANTGGGVLILGVGTDRADRAEVLNPLLLRTVEQQVVQAAREGIDEPVLVDPIQIPTKSDPAKGYLVVVVPPSDRMPHISIKKGRVLHRVGTHNKPMTRREMGSAFTKAGKAFLEEFGLITADKPALLSADVDLDAGSGHGTLRIQNSGEHTAFNISIEASTSPLRFEVDAGKYADPFRSEASATPLYMPITALPPASHVTLRVIRDWGEDLQDVLTFTWEDDAREVHRSQQSVTWPIFLRRLDSGF